MAILASVWGTSDTICTYIRMYMYTCARVYTMTCTLKHDEGKQVKRTHAIIRDCRNKHLYVHMHVYIHTLYVRTIHNASGPTCHYTLQYVYLHTYIHIVNTYTSAYFENIHTYRASSVCSYACKVMTHTLKHEN